MPASYCSFIHYTATLLTPYTPYTWQNMDGLGGGTLRETKVAHSCFYYIKRTMMVLKSLGITLHCTALTSIKPGGLSLVSRSFHT